MVKKNIRKKEVFSKGSCIYSKKRILDNNKYFNLTLKYYYYNVFPELFFDRI